MDPRRHKTHPRLRTQPLVQRNARYFSRSSSVFIKIVFSKWVGGWPVGGCGGWWLVAVAGGGWRVAVGVWAVGQLGNWPIGGLAGGGMKEFFMCGRPSGRTVFCRSMFYSGDLRIVRRSGLIRPTVEWLFRQ